MDKACAASTSKGEASTSKGEASTSKGEASTSKGEASTSKGEADQKAPKLPRYSKEYLLNECSKLITYEERMELEEITEIYCFGNGVDKPDSYHDLIGHYVAIPKDHLLFRYEICKELSYGTFGKIIQAFDYKYEKNVAIKIIRKIPACEKVAKQELETLKFLQGLSGKGKEFLVTFYREFNFRNHMCFVFELLGDDLASLINKNTSGMNRNTMRSLISCILNGLHFLHTNNIIHVDLKPNNIVLIPGKKGQCKIIDFGLSMYADKIKRSERIQVLKYRAPEIFLKAEFDTKIDIFSLGVIVSEMAVGRKPYEGGNDTAQLYTYVEIFGFPPRRIILNSMKGSKYFFVTPGRIFLQKTTGNKVYDPNSISLEDHLSIFNEPELINFIEKCLAMDPSSRLSADQLLALEWMKL